MIRSGPAHRVTVRSRERRAARHDERLANPLLGRPVIHVSDAYDPFAHYALNTGPTDEFGDLPEAPRPS